MITSTESLADHLLANERNLESLYTLLASVPGVDYYESPEYIRICSGVPHPLVNTVLRLRLDVASADDAIASLLQYFKVRELPVSWMLNGSSRPVMLEPRLIAHGMKSIAEMPGMAVDLSAMRLPTAMPRGVEIVAVTHTDTGATFDWNATTSAASSMPTEVIKVFEPLLKFSDCISAYTAYLNGKPVGTSLLYMDGVCAGIYCVAVLPEARRLGIGAAVTTHALQAARKQGYKMGVLQSSKMGRKVYERLGFKAYGRFTVYSTSA